MITLMHRSSEPVQVGQRLKIPNQWAVLPPHEVTVQQVSPDRTGQPRVWATGVLASNGETVMVCVWTTGGQWPGRRT